MALREVLDPETFKMATLNLVWLHDNMSVDTQSFEDAAAVLRILIDDAPRLAEHTAPEVIEALHVALHRFVPEYTDWNDVRLKEFLRSKADFLEGAAKYTESDRAEIEPAHAFCETMWATLAYIRNREMRETHAAKGKAP